MQPVQKKRPGGESAPLPGLSTGLPWLYFLCRAVSVWFPRRRNSINPTPKSVNAANATVGADTPVLASWRIVFTMAGVAGKYYDYHRRDIAANEVDYLNVEDPDVFSHRAWELEYQRKQEIRRNQPARTKKRSYDMEL